MIPAKYIYCHICNDELSLSDYGGICYVCRNSKDVTTKPTSTLTEQLRAALEQTTPIDVEYSPLTPHGEGIKAIQDLLPLLLDEHERLERESYAGKMLAGVVDGHGDCGCCEEAITSAVSTYRSACEGTCQNCDVHSLCSVHEK